MTKKILTLISFLSVAASFGHGSNKLGPNGGYIRMPGAFHTELVPVADGKVRVYLLDEDLDKPTTRNSTLTGVLKKKSGEVALECAASGNFFSCELPQGAETSSGDKFIFQGSRVGARGGNAVYELPLRLRN